MGSLLPCIPVHVYLHMSTYSVASSVAIGFVYNVYNYTGASWWNVTVEVLAWVLFGLFG